MSTRITITSVEFSNYKALERYSIKSQHMNILVGPNNCGKSTILSAFRVLAAGIRRARAKSAEVVSGPNGESFGYIIPHETLPTSIENVHSNYTETDTRVTFRLSNGNKLLLYFPADGGCFMLMENQGKSVRTPTDFRKTFPLTIGLVPVLGPLEHEEVLLDRDTVRRHLASHRASRHFRNYWYHFPEGFEVFAELVSKTWPGMTIQAPERVDLLAGKLAMFCVEGRFDRELYWAGFGFQVWCQLLTHISRSKDDNILVIDEPEIYLHPDVQRQLLSILRETGPDIIIATHSTEIMGEADPAEILLIDKNKRTADRLRDIEGVQAALNTVGSIQNITLAQLARNRRVLFVEGLHDFNILRKFARRIGLADLSTGMGITPIESGGFSAWERIQILAEGIEKTLGSSLHIGAIFDRDYRSTEEVDSILGKLNQQLDFAYIHERKEIENYLLVPKVLERALRKALIEHSNRSGTKAIEPESIIRILTRVSSKFSSLVQSQLIAKRMEYFKHSGKAPSTISQEAIELFELKWKDLDTRMEILPGKNFLGDLRNEIQTKYSVNLTDHKIIDEFKKEEIPQDILDLLERLDIYRLK